MTEKRFDVMIDTVFNHAEFYDTENCNKLICICRLADKDDLKEVLNNLVDENEQLKKELESFKPIIFESDGKPVTLYKKGDGE